MAPAGRPAARVDAVCEKPGHGSKQPASEPSPIDRSRYEREELLAISRALSSERDIRKLLDLILDKSRRITGADAGSVYVMEAADADGNGQPDGLAFGDPARLPWTLGEVGRRRMLTPAGGLQSHPARLHFMLSQNDSVAVDFKEFTLPVDDTSLAGRAVLAGRPINVPDVGQAAAAAGSNAHNRSFDDKIGYRARSMLTVPMLSAEGEVIGVIQLINKKRRPSQVLSTPTDFEEGVVPFDERAEEMALALASQAGVSLENAILYDEIRRLFESFVDASVTAIESRDPTTSGHSRRVATLSVALAEKVDAVDDGPLAPLRFSREDLRQIEYAGVLHDFGKVGVREQVLVKAKKLYDHQLEAIRLRLAYVRKSVEAESLRQQLEHIRRGSSADALAAIEREQTRATGRPGRVLAPGADGQRADLAGTTGAGSPGGSGGVEVCRRSRPIQAVSSAGRVGGPAGAARQPDAVGAPADREPRQSHGGLPADHSLGPIAAQGAADRRRPSRVAQRCRLPGWPTRCRDPHRGAHVDHCRHLRCADCGGPALQSRGPGAPCPGYPGERGQDRPLRC